MRIRAELRQIVEAERLAVVPYSPPIAVYGVLLVVSLIHGNGFLLWSWLLPLVVGQPFLRFWLLAEHTGCSYGPDGTTNTRTTRTHPLL
ncbi:MAG: hypothetical protein EBS90_13755, partial [Betaproteobacteria bacterium]|nr:hypothetical protein [Betaproteobacteria bacterium]